MADKTEILQLRILVFLLVNDEETRNVTGIAKSLGEEKYTVSRIMSMLEKEGLIDRSESRHPKLTKLGKERAKFYKERISISMNHLTYEGVDVESARNDAYYWALYNTQQTMDVIGMADQQYQVKYELRGQKKFDGAQVCQRLKDENYRFPFVIYREHVRGGSNLSMANEGFEHPCVLCVRNGVGTIQLRALDIEACSGATGKVMCGKVKSVKYMENEKFISAETSGNMIAFPAAVLDFVNVGEGIGQVLHGSVCLKMTCSVGKIHMPESKAIFTILI